MTISIKRDVLIRLEQELKAAQDLGIKRDVDSWVVTVYGRVRRTGFPTKRSAKRFSRSVVKTDTMPKCGLDDNALESLKIFNGAVERFLGTGTKEKLC